MDEKCINGLMKKKYTVGWMMGFFDIVIKGRINKTKMSVWIKKKDGRMDEKI